MSTSSVKSARSDRQAGRLADAPHEPQARRSSVRAALSMHCASSLVQAAFSSRVAATGLTQIGKLACLVFGVFVFRARAFEINFQKNCYVKKLDVVIRNFGL